MYARFREIDQREVKQCRLCGGEYVVSCGAVCEFYRTHEWMPKWRHPMGGEFVEKVRGFDGKRR